MEYQPTIFVVDDDHAVSRAMQSVGQLLDWPVLSFDSAEAFISSDAVSRPGCLILDIRMPGMTGMELQRQLGEGEFSMPVIMISGHADVPIAVEAMRRGALTLLEKPFGLDEVAAHIRRAMQIDAQRRAQHDEQKEKHAQLARLTQKEREVFDLITDGRSNKQMAASLHLSIRAVEDRRARVMKKLAVRSPMELFRFTTA